MVNTAISKSVITFGFAVDTTFEAVSNLGPLTTTWTMPSNCLEPTDLAFSVAALAPTLDFSPQRWSSECYTASISDSRCYPPASDQRQFSAPAMTTFTASPDVYFHSPGIHCPAAWTTALVQEGPGPYANPQPITERIKYIMQTRMVSGETLVICCPSAYDLGGFLCQSETRAVLGSTPCTTDVRTGSGGVITKSITRTTVQPDIATSTRPAFHMITPVVLVHYTTDLPSTAVPIPTTKAGAAAGFSMPKLRVVVAVAAAAAGWLLASSS